MTFFKWSRDKFIFLDNYNGNRCLKNESIKNICNYEYEFEHWF